VSVETGKLLARVLNLWNCSAHCRNCFHIQRRSLGFAGEMLPTKLFVSSVYVDNGWRRRSANCCICWLFAGINLFLLTQRK
jgi:hypothetical protein